MRKLAAILLGFGYMVLLIESVRTGVAWWHGELTDPSPLQWLMLAALPVLAWIWWRYLSVFRPGCGTAGCQLPDDRPAKPAPPDKAGR